MAHIHFDEDLCRLEKLHLLVLCLAKPLCNLPRPSKLIKGCYPPIINVLVVLPEMLVEAVAVLVHFSALSTLVMNDLYTRAS